MIKNNVYVLGSINTDLVIYTNRVPNEGETIAGSDFSVNAGGKGANQAVAVPLLGSNVKMIAAVGNDTNKTIAIDSLVNSNVDISNIKTVNDIATGTAVIIRTKG